MGTKKKSMVTRIIAVTIALLLFMYNIQFGMFITAVAKTDQYQNQFTLQIVNNGNPVPSTEVWVDEATSGLSEPGMTDAEGVVPFQSVTDLNMSTSHTFYFYVGLDEFSLTLPQGTTDHYIYDVATGTATKFEPTPPAVTHSLTVTQTGSGKVKINGADYTAPMQVEDGKDAVVNITPDPNYEIKTVKINNSNKTISDKQQYLETLASLSSDTVIEVEFVQTTFLVNVNKTGSGDISLDGIEYTTPVQVEKGADVAFAVTPAANYEIKSVTVGGESKDITDKQNYTGTISSISTDVAIDVEFMLKSYTITFNSNGNGELMDEKDQMILSNGGIVEVDHGSSTYFTVNPKTGHHVKEIKIDEGSIDLTTDSHITNIDPDSYKYTFNEVTENHLVEVTFAVNSYDISSSVVGGNGVVSLDKDQVDYNGDVNVTITPDDLYKVKSIKVNDIDQPLTGLKDNEDESGSFDYTLDTIEENKNIKVEFEKAESLIEDWTTYLTVEGPEPLNETEITTINVYSNDATVNLSTKDPYNDLKLSGENWTENGRKYSIQDNTMIESFMVKNGNNRGELELQEKVLFLFDRKSPVVSNMVLNGPDQVTFENSEWFSGKVTVSGEVANPEDTFNDVAYSTDIDKVYFAQGDLTNEESLTGDEANFDQETNSFTFETVDPEENTDFKGVYSVWAVDKAGNVSAVKTIDVNIDKKEPSLADGEAITFDIVDKDNISKVLRFLSFGTYSNDNIEVTVRVKNDASGIKEIALKTDDPDVVPQLVSDSFKKEGVSAEAKFLIDADRFTGSFEVEVTDNVKRKVTKSVTDANSNIENNTSGIVMIERTSPQVEIGINHAEDVSTYNDEKDQQIYSGDVTFEVSAEDLDSGLNNVTIDVNGTNAVNENYSKTETKSQQYTIITNTEEISEEGSFEITVSVVDHAGNTHTETKKVFIDTAAPEILGYIFSSENEGGGYDSLDEADILSEYVGLTNYGYYFKKQTMVTVKAEDYQNNSAYRSGVKSMEVYLKDINGTYFVVESDGSLSELQDVTMDPETNQPVITPIPSEGEISFITPEDFKGEIFAKAIDHVNNTGGFVTSAGTIIESKEQHEKETHIAFSKKETPFKDNNDRDLYAEDLEVDLKVTDTYSGIREIEWFVEGPYDDNKDQHGILTVDNDPTDGDIEGWKTVKDKNLVQEMTKTLTVNHNSNDIAVKVKMTDRAGNVTEDEIKFSIDKTVPTIDVSYDNNKDDSKHQDFFKEDRKATIVITERNFSPEEVIYSITKDGEETPVQVEWTSTPNAENPDLTSHTGTVNYSADGDYAFNIEYKDKAQNAAATFPQHSFTLDKTAPEIEVDYDNQTPAAKNYYDDVRKATIKIKEHNFDPSRVSISGTAIVKGKEINFPSASDWTTNGEVHTATIDYSTDALYRFDVDFIDKAGNKAEDYDREEFYVDKTPATLVEGKGAVQMVQVNDNLFAEVINFLSFGTFFNKEIQVTVKVKDEVSGINDIALKTDGDKVVPKKVKDSLKKDDYTGEAIFTVDGIYKGKFHVEVTDNSLNKKTYLVTKDNSQIESDNSEIMIEKNKPVPSIKVIPDKGVFSKGQEYNGEVTFDITAQDEESGINTVKIIVNGNEYEKDDLSDEGKLISRKSYKIHTTDKKININKDGSYNVSVYVIDNAGNAQTTEKKIFIDKTNPEIMDYVFSVKDQKTSYKKIEETEDLTDSVQLTEYGFYFKKQTRVTVMAEDPQVENEHTSKVKSITVYLKDYENGNFYQVLSNGKTQKIKESEIGKIAPIPATKEISFDVPEAFKGQIFAQSTDNVSNTGAYVTPDGTIVENETQHKKEKHITLEKAETTTKDTNGLDLYADNVNVNLTVTDTYSGLGEIEWSVVSPYDTGNNQSGSITIKNDGTYEAGSDAKGWKQTKTEKNLVYEMNKNLTVSNNSNEITVKVKVTDRSGNTSEEEMEFSIDKTIPKVDVSYDNNTPDPANKDFYKEDRTATIVVTERNFDAKDVDHMITNTDGVIPSLSGWKSHVNKDNPDMTTYTATVKYAADGDYTFDIKYQDNANNVAPPVKQDKFTIDKTKPEINVTYSNGSALNGNYYNKARTATITIKEHNFEPGRIRVTGKATDDGKAVSFPNTSKWTRNGDLNTATIQYGADALYSFDIDYTDMAGNDAADYKVDEFYVDQTAPKLNITGVQDKSANNGDVAPVIAYSDTNFNENGVKIELSGANQGSVKPVGSYSKEVNGQVYTFKNFEKKKENDDLYTLTATLTDFAGNETKEQIQFSVNRYGSVYVFDDALKGMIGKYVQKEKDVVLTETNVDSLMDGSISLKMTKNGTPTDLQEGIDYTVSKSGGKGQWSQYTYTVKKDLFTGDGKYTVALYSEDAAGNINENIDETKKAEISFGIDKTAPVVVPIDIESGKQYAVDSKDVTISIKDNLVLQDAAFYVNGQKVEHHEDGENYTFTIPSSNSKQTLKITAVDAAKNELTTEVNDFLVTTNLVARWYNNTPLFAGSLGGLGAISIATVSYFVFRKQKMFVDLPSDNEKVS
ncbi:hypothetical protein LCM10_09325 [Rossellomorea aquimaris]|uniref:hypothetical protein n=1 Tax=Rossellomorea aquimaris TaxID=189382 RepID=UPI001CD2E329|nr:hypothetical protein [Rossellomorea aquimaris]MCA1055188.1 hypothetical protein [Rossellomorea aquimaris]